VLANFITRVTIGGKTVKKTTGTFTPVCDYMNFPVPGCLVAAADKFNFDKPLTCTAGGAFGVCPTKDTVPGCCPLNGQVCSVVLLPVCTLSGAALVTTVTEPSVTVPGFFAGDECMGSAPGGCRACYHCCIQAYGKDADAVTLCKNSFCNSQRIITRCVPRAMLAPLHDAVARRAVPYAPPPDPHAPCSTELCPPTTTCASFMF
jgi:hypothetical protein